MNSLKQLQDCGQSIWLDYIRRDLITSGEFQRLVEQDGVHGVTSNPTIFDKAIAAGAAYDDALRLLLAADPASNVLTLFEKLEIQDLQMAADILRPVYDQTEGADGFVSIEVSPRLAYDTAGSIAEAKRLWKAVNRPNLMVKIPSTVPGIQAVEVLIAEGININITLMFSLAHYEAVAQAYLRGLKRNAKPHQVSSVASFFVSRVDTEVDRALEANRTPEALSLRGKIAIANARIVYRRFREIFLGTPFEEFGRRGARLQRPLWASTGTKNPAFSDVLYIEELIGPHTINTIPPATLNAFRDHGRVQPTLEAGAQDAEQVLARLAKLGINLGAITEKLLADGITAFTHSMDELLASLKEKRRVLLESQAARKGGIRSARIA
ncbi:MAG TPA: transaldolase [Candidatus Eremiobacteraceae bacterium]|nr:transaldolase [Candidatus Eremiobacteraceae bacterium]